MLRNLQLLSSSSSLSLFLVCCDLGNPKPVWSFVNYKTSEIKGTLSCCSVVSDSLQHHGLQSAGRASLSFTISQSLLKLTSIESVMPSNYLILCHPLLLLPAIFSSFRVFSNESAFHIRWPKYWSYWVLE